MREFEQMEMQFFVKPGSELEWFKKWKETRLKWHKALGFGDDHYRFHDHDKLAHYANAATDIEFLMPFGFKEVEGIHSRTNFDLSQHEKFSGKNIKYFDPERTKAILRMSSKRPSVWTACSSALCALLIAKSNWKTVKPAWY